MVAFAPRDRQEYYISRESQDQHPLAQVRIQVRICSV